MSISHELVNDLKSAFDQELDPVVVFEGKGADGYHTIRIPTLVRTRENVLLAFAEARRDSQRDLGHIELVLRRSRDNGRTWGELDILAAEEGDVTMGNPCPFVLRESGEVVLLFTRDNHAAYCIRSRDGGETFNAPEEITGACRAFDYPWVRIATGPVHGCQLRSGRLFAPAWISDHEASVAGRNFRSCALLSDDDGRTWRAGAVLGDDTVSLNECTAFEKSAGMVVLNMRSQTDSWRYIAESSDGGETFGLVRRHDGLPAAVCQGSTLVLPDENGKKQLLFSDILPMEEGMPGGKRTRLTVRLSHDEGETWPERRCITQGPSGYADMAALDDGSVGMLCECGVERYNQYVVFCRFTKDWVRGNMKHGSLLLYARNIS